MAKIETYALSQPSLDDKVIGTDVNDDNITKNFSIGDIVALANGNIPPSSVNLEYISYPLFGILTTNTGGTNAVVPLVDYLNAGLLSPTDYIKLSEFAVTATGPITSSGGNTPNISTLMNTNKLIGRYSAGSGEMEEITIGAGLTLTGGTLTASGGSGLPKGTASGTDTYTTTISGVSAYVDGDAYLIRFTNGNTEEATLNINGLGARILYRNNDGKLIGGDITSGAEMLCVFNSTLNGFQCIGTAPNSLYTYVTNADTVPITKGQAVYAFGGQGDRLTVKRALNTSDATSAQTIGLVLSTSIGVNQKGLIILQGLLDGLSILPTATWADGDPVYLGATAGTITNVKPSAPNHLVYLGFVTTASNGSSGRLYVRPQNGYELQELHNVALSSPPNNNDGLFYENSTSLWKNKSIPTALGYTPEDVANKQTDLTASSTKYPTVNAVNTGLSLKVDANTAITGATKTKITYDSKGLVTSGADATTADIAESTNKLYVSDGDKGDITVSGNGTIWTIDAGAVALADMANLASGNIIGRTDAGSGAPQAITIGTGLTGSASTLTANLSVGVNNGQSVIGGAAASENLTLSSTSNATKGKIILGSLSAYDEANDRLGIGTTSPTNTFHISKNITASSGNALIGLVNGTLTASANNDTLNGLNVNLTFSNGAFTGVNNYLQSWSNGGTLRSFVRWDGLQQWDMVNTSNVNVGRIQYGYPSGNAGMAIFDWDTTNSVYFNRYNIANEGTFFYQGFHNINNLGGMALFNTTHNLVIGYTGTPTDSGFKLDVNGTARASTSLDTPIVRGSTSASGTLTLSSTSDATKGKILFGTSAYDEANNRLGIGTTSPLANLHIVGESSSELFFDRYITSVASVPAFLMRKARGSIASPLAIQSGDRIGVVGFRGYGSTAFSSGSRAFYGANASENWTDTANGTELVLFTTTNTTTTASERLRVCNNGNILIGTTTDSGFKLDVNGTARFQNDVTISDTRNIILSTSTGTKIGTATGQKIGFWNATPIVQPTTGVAAATLVSNAGTTLTSTDTFDGYTLQQIVKALRNIGILA